MPPRPRGDQIPLSPAAIVKFTPINLPLLLEKTVGHSPRERRLTGPMRPDDRTSSTRVPQRREQAFESFEVDGAKRRTLRIGPASGEGVCLARRDCRHGASASPACMSWICHAVGRSTMPS